MDRLNRRRRRHRLRNRALPRNRLHHLHAARKQCTTTTTSDTGLTPNTTYSYRVRAKDATPNYSGYSKHRHRHHPRRPRHHTTDQPERSHRDRGRDDGEPVMDRLDHAGGVTGYEIERCQGTGCTTFTLLKTVTTTTTSDTGLTPNTTYSYRVRAKDATPNYSGYTNTATATTAGSGGPPVWWRRMGLRRGRVCRWWMRRGMGVRARWRMRRGRRRASLGRRCRSTGRVRG